MLVQSHLSYLSGHCKNNNLHLYRTVFTIMAPISQYLAQKINYFIFLFLKPLLDICSFNGEVVGDDSVGHVERSLKAHYSLENISIFFCLVVFANRNQLCMQTRPHSPLNQHILALVLLKQSHAIRDSVCIKCALCFHYIILKDNFTKQQYEQTEVLISNFILTDRWQFHYRTTMILILKTVAQRGMSN